MNFNSNFDIIQNELQKLEALTKINGHFMSGDFRWRLTPCAENWAPFSDEENGVNGASSSETLYKAQQFHCFGVMGDGSIVALWKKKTGDIPVVFFGSEGQFTILANNFESWLQLMAIGYDDCGDEVILEPPPDVTVDELEYNPEYASGRAAQWFKDYVTGRGITIPRDGKEIYFSRQELQREFLGEFFDTAYLYCDYMQFFLTTENEVTSIEIPEDITKEDTDRGFKIFSKGIAFYFEDLNNLSTKISLAILNQEPKYPCVYQPSHLSLTIKEGGLTVFNLDGDKYHFKNPKIIPGEYRLDVLKSGGVLRVDGYSDKFLNRGLEYVLCLRRLPLVNGI